MINTTVTLNAGPCGNCVEADAWHVSAGGKRDPVFAVATLDDHAQALRRAVRPGYHGRIEHKLVGSLSERSVQPGQRTEPPARADNPISAEPVQAPEPVLVYTAGRQSWTATADLSETLDRIDYAIT
jgi:hypothetical protein